MRLHLKFRKKDEWEIIQDMAEAPKEESNSMAKHESREDEIFQKLKTEIALGQNRFLDMAEELLPWGFLTKISLKKRVFQIALRYGENI